ncbi:hypothetical protein TNCV_4155771 [Trichonephila clavipes]|nr:hypothetical protein TNCV_4155771 [Trichonephila clavipes]
MSFGAHAAGVHYLYLEYGLWCQSGETEKEKKERKRSEKTGAGRFLKEEKRGSLRFDRDADQESWTRIKNALRTVPRQAMEKLTTKRGLSYWTSYANNPQNKLRLKRRRDIIPVSMIVVQHTTGSIPACFSIK